jgi:hypothetical protein
MKNATLLTSLLAAALLAACGGSHPSPPPSPVSQTPATALAYTDPSSASGDWKLLKNATASTGTHLVLDLVGPSDGTLYRGIGFTLQADTTRVAFAQFRDDKGNPVGYYRDGGVFRDVFSSISNPTPQDLPATLQAGGVANNQLMVGIFQKTDDETWTAASTGVDGAKAKACATSVLQVAIDLDPSLKALPGSVSLAVVKARVIPQHVDTYVNRVPVAVPIQVGTLSLN